MHYSYTSCSDMLLAITESCYSVIPLFRSYIPGFRVFRPNSCNHMIDHVTLYRIKSQLSTVMTKSKNLDLHQNVVFVIKCTAFPCYIFQNVHRCTFSCIPVWSWNEVYMTDVYWINFFDLRCENVAYCYYHNVM